MAKEIFGGHEAEMEQRITESAREYIRVRYDYAEPLGRLNAARTNI